MLALSTQPNPRRFSPGLQIGTDIGDELLVAEYGFLYGLGRGSWQRGKRGGRGMRRGCLRQETRVLAALGREGRGEKGEISKTGDGHVAVWGNSRQGSETDGGLIEVVGQKKKEGAAEDVSRQESRGAWWQGRCGAREKRGRLEGCVGALFDGREANIGRTCGRQVVAVEDEPGVEKIDEGVQQDRRERRVTRGIASLGEGAETGRKVLVKGGETGRGDDRRRNGPG